MEIQKSTEINSRILKIQGNLVILDTDLAQLYGVTTKALNQAVKRNLSRFPIDFMFRIDKLERDQLVTNCDRLRKLKHSPHLPFAFTELGVAMLSSALNSDSAIQVNINIIRVFVHLKSEIESQKVLVSRVSNLESMVLEHDKKIRFFDSEFIRLYPKTGVFFNDQIFDAYVFSNELITSAKKSIVLIDNYIDETTLLQLSKRNPKVRCCIYTEKITPQLKLDVDKHNAQYPPIQIMLLKNVHDRFLILDQQALYHLGASLKDLGKRWFAFSRMDGIIADVMKKLP
jgi:hypothetical protein